MKTSPIIHGSCFLAGESGMGVDSSGIILVHALASLGLRCTTDRAYPSLIKGGQSSYTIHFSKNPIRATMPTHGLGIAMGKAGLLQAKELLVPGGTLLHNFERRHQAFPDLEIEAKQQGTTLMYIPTREILHELHLHHMFENALLIGAFARALGIPFETIQQACFEKRGKKEHLRDNNLLCLHTGYTYNNIPTVTLPETDNKEQKKMLIDGNTALALGAIHAGVRCYYAYPMSPSSSILSYFAATAKQTGIVVKQAEDEITAIQMALGSMYAGARALTATSGGGFDLMTETISLSGMTEVPLVCIIAQRPGPATGLPTRTAQADLQLAIHGGHGEFARIVIAVSDQESAFHLIQDAFDLAEQFQLPVIILTEKVIAENYRTVPVFSQTSAPINRGVITDPEHLKNVKRDERYMITESGVSPRRLPGTTTTTYFCNGDEHHPDGTLDESEGTETMIMKRIKKIDAIREILPDPILYGPPQADITFIGRGHTKSPMLDLIEANRSGKTINYLHIEYVYPLKIASIKSSINDAHHLCIIENNATGQLEQLLNQAGIYPDHHLRKRNGRSFTQADIITYIEHIT